VNDPVERVVELTVPLTGNEAAARIGEFARKLSRDRVDVHDGSGQARIGSRFAYRMWGATSPGFRRLPFTMKWNIVPGQSGVRVVVTLTSDEGAYAILTRWHFAAYDKKFSEVSDDLRTLLSRSGATS